MSSTCGEWQRAEEIVTDAAGKKHKRVLYRRLLGVRLKVDACDGYLDVPVDVPAGSIFVTSGTGEGYWLAKGDDGDYLRTLSGVPCWSPA